MQNSTNIQENKLSQTLNNWQIPEDLFLSSEGQIFYEQSPMNIKFLGSSNMFSNNHFEYSDFLYNDEMQYDLDINFSNACMKLGFDGFDNKDQNIDQTSSSLDQESSQSQKEICQRSRSPSDFTETESAAQVHCTTQQYIHKDQITGETRAKTQFKGDSVLDWNSQLKSQNDSPSKQESFAILKKFEAPQTTQYEGLDTGKTLQTYICEVKNENEMSVQVHQNWNSQYQIQQGILIKQTDQLNHQKPLVLSSSQNGQISTRQQQRIAQNLNEDLSHNDKTLTVDYDKKKCRSQLKTAEFKMEKTRGDVVFKTILRQMRKSLSDDFNKCTNYMKCKFSQKACQDPLFEMLNKYVSLKFQVKKQTQTQQDDLEFFLGAFLYPKQMKKLVQSNTKQRQIDEIHNSLYSFSICKLDYLSSYPAYSLVLSFFIKSFKDKVMRTNQTMSNAKSDFNQGFSYLLQYYTQQ
eukprot:403369617